MYQGLVFSGQAPVFSPASYYLFHNVINLRIDLRINFKIDLRIIPLETRSTPREHWDVAKPGFQINRIKSRISAL